MNKFDIAYFYFGGAIIIATVVTFLWVVLTGTVPTLLQWLAAAFLLGIGIGFMATGSN